MVPSADLIGTVTAKPWTSSAPYTDLVTDKGDGVSFEKSLRYIFNNVTALKSVAIKVYDCDTLKSEIENPNLKWRKQTKEANKYHAKNKTETHLRHPLLPAIKAASPITLLGLISWIEEEESVMNRGKKAMEKKWKDFVFKS